MTQMIDAQKAAGGMPKLLVSEHSRIRRIIAVMSGKGGVGKSTVTTLLAAALRHDGHRVGILDADITGPSIPKLLGLRHKPASDGDLLLPSLSQSGIRVMSMNLLLPHDSDPVIWRGPLVARAVQQFYTDVSWGEIDYLVVDLPPGTGDSPLTVLQSLPVDGLVVVSSPQDLAAMVVMKAVKMAQKLEIPIIGVVENMSSVKCPYCGESFSLFGEGQTRRMCSEHGLRFLGVLPLDPLLAKLCDQGLADQYDVAFLHGIPELLPPCTER